MLVILEKIGLAFMCSYIWVFVDACKRKTQVLYLVILVFELSCAILWWVFKIEKSRNTTRSRKATLKQNSEHSCVWSRWMYEVSCASYGSEHCCVRSCVLNLCLYHTIIALSKLDMGKFESYFFSVNKIQFI